MSDPAILHLTSFDGNGGVCGARGQIWSVKDWDMTPEDATMQHCKACGGAKRSSSAANHDRARDALTAANTAYRLGEDEGARSTEKNANPYNIDTAEHGAYDAAYVAATRARTIARNGKPETPNREPTTTTQLRDLLRRAAHRAQDYTKTQQKLLRNMLTNRAD